MLPVRTNGSPFQTYGRRADQREPAAAGRRHGRRRADRLGEPARRAARHGRGAAHMRRSTSTAAAAARSGSRWRARRQCRRRQPVPPAAPGIDLDLRRRWDLPDAPHPGITDIEAYGSFGGDVGLNVQVGKYIRFRGLFGLPERQPHFITAAGAGVPASPRNARRTRRIPPRRTRSTARRSTFRGGASASRGREFTPSCSKAL